MLYLMRVPVALGDRARQREESWVEREQVLASRHLMLASLQTMGLVAVVWAMLIGWW